MFTRRLARLPAPAGERERLIPMPIIMSLLFLCLAVPAAATGAHADRTEDQLQDGIISSITFEGNTRTKEVVLRRAVGPEPGDEFNGGTVEEIEDDLKSLGIFSEVEVQPQPIPGGVDVLVTVEERWTLVPIPFFSSTSSGYTGGVFVFESNLFGYNKQLITGGSYGSDGFGGLLVYSDPAVLGNDWLFSTSVNAGREEVETADLAYDDRWTFSGDSVRAGGALGYRLTDYFSVRAGGDWEYIEVTDTELPGTVKEKGYGFATYSVEASFDLTEPEEFFDSGYSVQAQAETTPGASGWVTRGGITVNYLLFGAHRLGLTARGAYGDQPFLLLPRLGGRQTQRTLTPGTIAEDQFVSEGVSYELPVFSFSWATITALGFYESGYLGRTEEVYHGGGGGLRLYLSRVTFPAVGFDFAWNVTEHYPVFSFALGGRI